MLSKISEGQLRRSVCVNLDDLVLHFESCSCCRRVLVHSPDELALRRLLAVQIEAIAILPFLHVAKTRAQAASFLLQTHVRQINQRRSRWEN